jgi:hypothetical protein
MCEIFLSIPNNKIDTTKMGFFNIACMCKNINAVKWLYKINNGNIDIQSNKNEAFYVAYKSERFDTLDWLIEKGNIDVGVQIDCSRLFSHTMFNNDLFSKRWIYEKSKGNIDIRIMNDYIFTNACNNNKIELVDWLCSICPLYSYRKNDEHIISHHVRGYEIIYDDTKQINGSCPVCCLNDNNCMTSCDHLLCYGCYQSIMENIQLCPLCQTDASKIVYMHSENID